MGIDDFVMIEGQLMSPPLSLPLHQGHVQPEISPAPEKSFLLSNCNPSYCLYFLAQSSTRSLFLTLSAL